MTQFDDDTTVRSAGDGRWIAMPTPAWNIGDNANGGYALSLVLRAFGAAQSAHPDPLSVTTHFLRPLQPDGTPAEIDVETVRRGRTTSVLRGTVRHAGRERVAVLAAFGDLGHEAVRGAEAELAEAPPRLPPPDECTDRARLEQGVTLAILRRVDVRIRPDHAEPGTADAAVIEGWIRLADGASPTTGVLPLFADAFPPSLFPRFGRVGWVPTIELTVHVRRRPAPGWVQARFECDDLAGGRMIETGTLWDSTGALVARSRQLGVAGLARPATGA